MLFHGEMPVFRLFNAISFGLGRSRTLIRRLGGLALILMGVHAAADILDNLAYEFLDALDLVVDETAASFLGWLSSTGGLTPDAAVAAIERFASAVDLGEKDWLALRLAFAAELLLDVLLLDLCWGSRVFDGANIIDDLKRSAEQLRRSLTSFDLERVLAPTALATFAVGGAVLAALALEQPTSAVLTQVLPGLAIASNIGAATAIVVVAILVWRFVPELLHGAIVRAHVRGERARAKRDRRRERAPPRWPGVTRYLDGLRRVMRGAWLGLALFVAVTGLLGGTSTDKGHGGVGLIERLGATP